MKYFLFLKDFINNLHFCLILIVFAIIEIYHFVKNEVVLQIDLSLSLTFIYLIYVYNLFIINLIKDILYKKI